MYEEHHYDFYCTHCDTKAKWEGGWSEEATLMCGDPQCLFADVVYGLDALLHVMLQQELYAQYTRAALRARGALNSPPPQPFRFRVEQID